MIFKLLQIEILKTRRSLALLMMFACPLLVVLLIVMMAIQKNGGAVIYDKGWSGLWLGSNALWCHFMLPLYIALVTTLLNGNEHSNGTWRLMLTLPIKTWQLYLTKGILAWLFVFGASAFLFAALSLSIAVLIALGYPGEGAFDYPVFEQTAKSLVACLPILFIQHALSWRFGHIVLPLAVGVIGTMGILSIGLSQYWIYYPWSYVLMASMGGDAANQLLSLQISALMGAVLMSVSCWWFSRRSSG